MDDALASRLTGLLYGNILHRNSDDDGFDYHFKLMKDDKVRLDDLVLKFFTSDEFVEKFVVNQTPNELVTNLLQSFFGSSKVKTEDHSALRKTLVHAGLDAVIKALVADKRYGSTHGAKDVPRYVERAAPQQTQTAAA